MSDSYLNEGKIICKNCGGENESGGRYCINCGSSLEKKAVQAEEVSNTDYYPNYRESLYEQEEGKRTFGSGNSGWCIASMITGVISLMCCLLSVFTAPFALVSGIVCLTKKYEGKGMAIVGIITGALAMLIYGAILVFFIYVGATEGLVGSGGGHI